MGHCDGYDGNRIVPESVLSQFRLGCKFFQSSGTVLTFHSWSAPATQNNIAADTERVTVTVSLRRTTGTQREGWAASNSVQVFSKSLSPLPMTKYLMKNMKVCEYPDEQYRVFSKKR